MSHIRNFLRDKTLDELATLVREKLEACQKAARLTLASALDAGDALIEALSRISSDRQKWLRQNCFLSLSTAKLYVQLAQHREEIEAEIDRAGELSIRAARRLIASESSRPPKVPAPNLIAAMRKATDAERTAMLAAFGLEPFLRVMPADWRPKLEARVVHLRANEGHPDLKVTQVLRSALSFIKIANTPGTSDAMSNANRHEACAALQQLNALLLRGGFDLNDVTVNTAKMASSKSRRRAA
jgi:hypothetical protein